uniref:Uncharacterized protein n=1 Tax=Vombatus ursinus TaxID=29139 RepID=A0A4X2KZX8_VOMUR
MVSYPRRGAGRGSPWRELGEGCGGGIRASRREVDPSGERARLKGTEGIVLSAGGSEEACGLSLPAACRKMENLMSSSSLPPLFADDDGSKESSDMAAVGLAHPEVTYPGGATPSTNNTDFVEDLSQVQLLQNESSNTVENSEQRHEDE